MAENTEKKQVNQKVVTADEDGIRLDRWIKTHFPAISHVLLQKLLRKKAVRVDNKRAKADTRLKEGQEIRVPDIAVSEVQTVKKPPPKASPEDITQVKNSIIYENKDILVLNKPPALATQGGTKVINSVDSILREIYTPAPKLIHRLDKDTSGVLLVAKNRKIAEEASKEFQTRETKKVYWAIAIGVPKEKEGQIFAPLTKMQDKVVVDKLGKTALTSYKVIDNMGKKLSLIEVEPLTGRTHQIRVHLAHIGHPILGDGKYGGKDAFPDFVLGEKKLCLHAKHLEIMLQDKKYAFDASVSEHMKEIIKVYFTHCC